MWMLVLSGGWIDRFFPGRDAGKSTDIRGDILWRTGVDFGGEGLAAARKVRGSVMMILKLSILKCCRTDGLKYVWKDRMRKMVFIEFSQEGRVCDT